MSVYRLDVTFSRWLAERFAPPLVRAEINPYAHAGIWPTVASRATSNSNSIGPARKPI